MTRTMFASPALNRPRLSAVWIETGNPAQPLACIWIDRDLRIVNAAAAMPEVCLRCA